MDNLLAVEIASSVLGLIFITLLIYENIWCWFFAIISAILSVYLFYQYKLYSESILYFYYILNAIYGYYIWSRVDEDVSIIKKVSLRYHTIVISIGIVFSLLLGFFFYKNSDAERPFCDASSTIFSFLASYLEANKILSTWIYWIVINAFSVWLYMDRQLKVYAFLMVVYFLLSIVGYIQWKNRFQQHKVIQ